MVFKTSLFRFFLLVLSGCIFVLGSCITNKKTEVVNIGELLPEGAVTEITHGHPDFNVSLVSDEDANVSAKFGKKHLRIDGVEKEDVRERLANYVLQYLENPNKKVEDKAKREAYEKLPPKEKMNSFVSRMKEHYPSFDYNWTGLGEGNVKVEYGDNALLISGVEKEGAREEIAHGIIRIQKEIDKLHKGEHEGEHEHGSEHGQEHDHESEEHKGGS